MQQQRLAVSLYFFINGFLYANWAARLPELQAHYQISNAELGSLLFTMALGAVVAMPFAGWLVTQKGSERTTQIAAWLYVCLIPLLAMAPGFSGALLVFFLLGVTSGSLDVSMNGQSVYVERRYGRPIMSSFHAVFSIGMALGAGTGALGARFHLSLPWHLALAALVCCLIIAWAGFHLITTPRSGGGSGGFVWPTKAVLPLGIIAFCCMTGEGAMADWSAIYLKTVVGAAESFSALGVGAFGAAMTLGRLFGDRFTEHFGKQKLLQYNSLLALAGLSLALLWPGEWSSLAGFFLVGLGLANIVPIVYSSAGNTPGVEPSVGIAMATTIGYAGFFVGPPAIGFLADEFGLRVGLAMVLGLFLLMWLLVKNGFRQ